MDHPAPRIPDPGAGPTGANRNHAGGRLSPPHCLITVDRYIFSEPFSGFQGFGFAPSPTGGQLDSDLWRVTGFSDGNAAFGDTNDSGDFARGSSAGGISQGGIYAFDADGDTILGVQPIGSDFTPGTITLLLTNETGAEVDAVDIAYEVWARNDQTRANSLTFAYSTNDVSYTAVAALDFTSPEAPDILGWMNEDRSATLTGLSLAPGANLYLQWQGDDVSGSGSRDEFGIDDIAVSVAVAEEDCPTDLFISEYIEGSSFNKAIELFNGTGAAIDLGAGGYTLELYSNGNSAPNSTLALSGTVADGDVFVLANPSADPTILAEADVTNGGVINFNGDDTVVLRKNGEIVDSFGQIGVDPGSQWPGGGLNDTLQRLPSVIAGDTDASDPFDASLEWTVLPENAFDGLGSHSIDKDPAGDGIAVAPLDAERDEGDAGTTAFTFTVTRSGDTSGATTVDYAVTSSEADAADFGGSLPSGTVSFAADDTEQTVTVDVSGDTDAEADEAFDVTLSNPANGETLSGPASGLIRNDDGFAVTRISDIQGPGDASPLAGSVVTVSAVVVGDFQDGVLGSNGDLNGFYLQEEDSDTDADPNSSEGIFVFDGSFGVDVAVGDVVEVTDTVTEFFGETQIGSVTRVEVVGSGQSGLAAPSTVTFPMASSRVNSDGELIADLEAYEGMLVTVPQEMTIGTLFGFGRYGEIGLFGRTDDSIDGRLPIYTQVNAPDAGGAQIAAYEDAAARSTVFLDDGSSFQNPEIIPYEASGGPNGTTGATPGQYDADDELRSGDTITDLTGVIRFSRGSGGSGDEIYRINPVEEVTIVNENPREPAPEVDGRLTVASLNVLNLFTTIDDGASVTDGGLDPRGADDLTDAPSFVAPSTQAMNDPTAEFDRQLDKIVAQIAGIDADVLGLVELENSASDAALMALVNALNASPLTGRTYDYVPTGLIGTDAITAGFIYDTGTVGLVGDAAILDTPAFLDPNATGQDRNRPAVAQTFEELSTGEDFTAVVN
ncbi:MAG: lamin tail domain-containing protein, partial [Actinomycetota bacterium]